MTLRLQNGGGEKLFSTKVFVFDGTVTTHAKLFCFDFRGLDGNFEK